MLVRPLPLLNFFVVLVMLSIGLRVRGGELLEILRNRSLFTKTLLANCVLIPSLGFLLVNIFPLNSFGHDITNRRLRTTLFTSPFWLGYPFHVRVYFPPSTRSTFAESTNHLASCLGSVSALKTASGGDS